MFQSKTASFTDGVTLAYTDTGPVPGSDNYTTLVVLHGSAFNGYGCEKLHEHCHQLNLRTIIFMRREFPGSTKYSDSEIDDLHNGRKVFIDRLCVQMAEFMKQLVDSGIPKISSDGKNGGIAIMGWSMGSATAMSLFSDVSLIPAPLYEELQLYVKDLVLDDPPYVSFGFLLPEDEKTYNPWTDPKCTTPEDSNQNLMRWASSYYDEHDMSTGHVNQLDMRSATSHNTFTNWSQADLNKYYDEAAVVRCELRMYVPPMQGTLSDMTNRVLFSSNLVFPRAELTYVCCLKSNWHSVFAGMEMQKRYAEKVEKGDPVRKMKYIEMPEGNHFAVWDSPKALLEDIVKGIRG